MSTRHKDPRRQKKALELLKGIQPKLEEVVELVNDLNKQVALFSVALCVLEEKGLVTQEELTSYAKKLATKVRLSKQSGNETGQQVQTVHDVTTVDCSEHSWEPFSEGAS